MKAIRHTLLIRRPTDQGRNRIDGRDDIVRFGWHDADWRRDERRKTIAFDGRLRHPGFVTRIDAD